MNFREKLVNWVAGKELAKIQARYEAAYWNNSRSYLPGFIQSAREDISALPRQEILRRVRYFEKNSGVLLKILRCLDVNVIGSGITPTPSGPDIEWNKSALEWWDEWVPCADVTEQSDYYKLQSIAFRAQNVDGDSFKRHVLNANGRPAIDIIEAHRCGTGTVNTQDVEARGFKVIDGVILDSYRRPVAYLIADDFMGGHVETVGASKIVKHFSRKRAGQYRGISIMHAGILTLHDLDDLQKYEMRAAKDAASKANIFETPAGAVSQEEAIGASLSPAQNTDPTQRLAMYRQAIAGETLVLQPGEKMTQFESNRPSAATSGYWDRLDEAVVRASGVSYAALCDYRGNWGGATLRAVVTSDNRTYELETIEQARAAQRDWEFAIGWAIQSGELKPNPCWNKVRWHPPRRATVDIGNDSKAMISELQGGLRTYETCYGENGEDWKERLTQRAVEEKFINDLADQYGVDRQYIVSFAQERMTAAMPTDPNVPEAGSGDAAGGDKVNARAQSPLSVTIEASKDKARKIRIVRDKTTGDLTAESIPVE